MMNPKTFNLILWGMFLLYSTQSTCETPLEFNDPRVPRLTVDFDDCTSFAGGSQNDYSEFIADEFNFPDCSQISLVNPSNVFRVRLNDNSHSCTPGIGNSEGMCIDGFTNCNFQPASFKSLRFNVQVTPGQSGIGSIDEVSFFEQAPEIFTFNLGEQGPNNYPQFIGLRVTANGSEIYRQENIPTERFWTLKQFNFTSNPNFQVRSTTIFNFEILPYCPVGNGAERIIWDIDQLQITGNCNSIFSGTLSTNDITDICRNTNRGGVVNVNINDAFGPNQQLILTDLNDNIIQIPSGNAVDFRVLPNGTYNIFNVVYDPGLTGLNNGSNLSQLNGCFDLSTPLVVSNSNLIGGNLRFDDGFIDAFICNQDFNDNQLNTNIAGNNGQFTTFIITDRNDQIIQILPGTQLDFSSFPGGEFNVTVASHNGQLINSVVGVNISELRGCFALSNSIRVVKDLIQVGSISLNGDTQLSLCGINSSSILPTVSGVTTGNSRWVVISPTGIILNVFENLPINLSNFVENGVEIRLISFSGRISGLEVNQSFDNIGGCFISSNSIFIDLISVNGGNISFDSGEMSMDVCIDDGIRENINVNLNSNVGTFSDFLIVDTNDNILNINNNNSFNFENVPPGMCRIIHISYEAPLTGLVNGNNLSNIGGCFDLSNELIVNRLVRFACVGGCFVDGGTVTVDNGFICRNGQTNDLLNGSVMDQEGGMQQLVLTTEDGEVLGLFDNFPIDLSGFTPDEYLVYNIGSFDDTGIDIGDDINQIQHDCFDLSDPASFAIVNNSVGQVSLEDGSDAIQICVGDNDNDLLTFISDGESNFLQYVITDENDEVLAVADINTFEFDNMPAGICRVWAVASSETAIIGIGSQLSEVLQNRGCIDISDNFIIVERFMTDGGSLTLTTNTFCVGDGRPDIVNGIIVDNIGNFSNLILTDFDSIVISVEDDFPFDVESLGDGICLLWNLATTNEVDVPIGTHLSDITDICFSISQPAIISRTANFGGEVSTANGLTEVEVCVSDTLLSSITFNTTGVGIVYQYIVTDSLDVIIALPIGNTIDFNGLPIGSCRVYGIAHNAVYPQAIGDELALPAMDNSCFDFSINFVLIQKFDSGIVCGEVICDALGGTINLTQSRFCVGDGQADLVDGTIIDSSGNFFTLLLTDVDSNVISTEDGFPFDVESFEEGTCLLWNLATTNDIDVAVGSRISEISDTCFALSQPVSITRTTNFGGEVSLDGGLTEIELCVGDTIPDPLVFNTTGVGVTYQYILTDTMDVIVALPSGNEVNFNLFPPGVCRVYGIAHNAVFTGRVGETLALPTIPNSCFEFSSNFITVERFDVGGPCGVECIVNAGVFSISANQFCVSDGQSDLLNANLVGSIGDFMQWVITDSDSVIIALPDVLPVDLDGVIAGNCLLWNVASPEDIILSLGQNVISITLECFDVSGPIPFSRIENNAGNVFLTDNVTSVDICLTDTIPDVLTFFNDGSGNIYRYVITDGNNIIIALPTGDTFDFAGLDPGVCRVHGVALQNDIELFPGLELLIIDDLNNCTDQSDNFIEINRFDSGVECGEEICIAEGGQLELSSNFFCVGDGNPDLVDGTITGGQGANMQLVVTDSDTVIIGLPNGFPFDIDNAGAGNCIVWNVASQNPIEFLIGSRFEVTQDTCFDLSNSVVLNRVENFGGSVNIVDGGTSIEICVGNAVSDVLFFENNGSSQMYSYLVTDDSNTIIALPDDNFLDFESFGIGTCRVWGIAHSDSLGFNIGDIVFEPEDLIACFDLSSNFIEVVRSDDEDACDVCLAQRNTCTDDEVGFILDDVTVETDSTICVSLRVTNFDSIITYQGGFMWDPTVLQFITTQNFNLPGLNPIGSFNIDTLQGMGSFVWFDNAGGAGAVTLPDSSAVFDICFVAIGDPGDNALLKVIDTDDTIIQVSTEDGEEDFCVDDACVSLIQGTIDSTFTLIADEIVTMDTMVCVDVRATNFVDITGMQFTMQWDSTFMCLDEVTNTNTSIGIFNGAFFQDGLADRVRFTWNNNETTIPDNTLLFSLCFDIKPGNCDESTTLNFVNDRVPIEISSGITPIPFELENGSVMYDCTNIINVEDGIEFSISPNPGDNDLNLVVETIPENQYSLLIHNSYGELFYRADYSDREKHKQMKSANWPDGIYYMTIISKNKRNTKKFLIIH